MLRAYSHNERRLSTWSRLYNQLMLNEESGLSKAASESRIQTKSDLELQLEREMLAVVVSSVNRCYYCLVAHGAAVRCDSLLKLFLHAIAKHLSE